jgi:hypothetical protein
MEHKFLLLWTNLHLVFVPWAIVTIALISSCVAGHGRDGYNMWPDVLKGTIMIFLVFAAIVMLCA